MTDDQYLSLTADDSLSDIFPITRAQTRAAIGITPSAWGGAVVEVEWTIDDDLERWFSFEKSYTLSSSVPARTGVPVAGLLAIRLRTITPGSGGDSQAVYDVRVT